MAKSRIWSSDGWIQKTLRGGKYGESQEERIKKTQQGKKLLEEIKTKGGGRVLWDSLKNKFR